MTTLREAAQQALEAWDSGAGPLREAEVFEALRAALAEPVQEPVAWSYELATTMLEHGYAGWEHRITRYKPNVPEGSIRNLTPLYTAPPQRKPLTEEEIDELRWAPSYENPMTLTEGLRLFARAIERAHEITEEMK